MFQKTHVRLTLLSAGIAAAILLAVSVLYLFLSEKNLRQHDFSVFEKDMEALRLDLDAQTVVTHKWLSTAEQNGTRLQLWDNGSALLWGSQQTDPQRRALIETALSHCSDRFPAAASGDAPGFSFLLFSYSVSQKKTPDCYACLMSLKKRHGTLTLLAVRPIEELNRQIRRQRMEYLLPVLAAVAALFLFFWYFTGKLLRPIEESRLSQIRFVAAASHELRTPLSAILSTAHACTQMLQGDDPEKTAECRRFLSLIEEEGGRMARLISDLLTLAGADSRNLRLSKTVCEPDTLLLDTYEAYEALAVQEGYRLSVRLPDQPDCPDKKTAPLECDTDRIRQVLSILLQNAFCHTPTGSHIALSLEEAPGCVSFLVSDDGPGIPDADKTRIFERFYQRDEARGQSGHFGLGLSIAMEIARAHRGRITVSDTPGGGATFTLILPA